MAERVISSPTLSEGGRVADERRALNAWKAVWEMPYRKCRKFSRRRRSCYRFVSGIMPARLKPVLRNCVSLYQREEGAGIR